MLSFAEAQAELVIATSAAGSSPPATVARPTRSILVRSVHGPAAIDPGNAGVSFLVHLENPGAQPLVIDRVGLSFTNGSGDAGADYAVREPARLPMTLAPGEHAWIDVGVDVTSDAATGVVVVDASARADAMTSPIVDGGADTTSRVSVADPSRDVARLYQRGLDAMNHGRSGDALRSWELVWTSHPGYLDVSDRLERAYQKRGMESFAAGRLDEAIGWWEKALQIDSKDARTIGYLARARKQLSRTREILGGTR